MMIKHTAYLIKIILSILQAAIDVFICCCSYYWAGYIFALPEKFLPIPQNFIFFAGSVLTVFYFNSLYKFNSWTFKAEFTNIIKSCALIFPLTLLYLYSQGEKNIMLSSGIIIFIPSVALLRYVFRRIFFALNILVTDIIILGAGENGKMFAEKIISNPFTACKIIGFLDDSQKIGTNIKNFPVLGKINDFDKIYEQYKIDEAAIAIQDASRALIAEILDMIEFKVRHVHYITNIFIQFSGSIHDVDGMPLIQVNTQ